MIEEARCVSEAAFGGLPPALPGEKSKTVVPRATRRTLAILYEQLGRLYRDVENYSAAINTFQEMLKLGEEEDRRARALVVGTHRAGRDLAQALQGSRKALGAHPKDRSIPVTHPLPLREKGGT